MIPENGTKFLKIGMSIPENQVREVGIPVMELELELELIILKMELKVELKIYCARLIIANLYF